MAWTRTVLYSALSSYLWHPSNAEYIWPNAKIDELEKILYEVNGPFNSGPGGDFAENVSGCSGRGAPSGRNFGAEWLRTAYHDMATADVAAGTGGLDASILFELDRAENPGDAFSETFLTFRGAHTTRASVADLLAVASVMAVGACSNGQVIIPFKGGRVDAAGPGPSGVPEPQQDIASHTAAFTRQGFDVSEMISLVACGHTIGGVHGVDFPEIVPNPPDTGTDNMVTFDTTNNNFDNSVAKEFVANVDQNPLAFGQNETTRSDFRIFNADGGKVISQMAKSEDFFLQTCNTLLERMINTVPSSVKLTDVIQPITIKPMMLQIEPNTTDGTLTVSGFVRLINTTVDVSQSQVLIHPKSRSGKLLPAATGSTQSDFVAACDIYPNCGPGFVFYQFNTTISAKDGISSFTVEVKNDAAGKTTQYTNGGSGFPFSDAIQLVNSLSKQGTNEDGSATTLNITALVLNAEDFSDVSLINYGPSNLTAPISPWIPIKTPMKALQKIPGTNFTLYTGNWTGNNFAGNHPFDLVATGDKCTVSSLFNEVTGSGVGGGPGGGKSKSPGGKKSRR